MGQLRLMPVINAREGPTPMNSALLIAEGSDVAHRVSLSEMLVGYGDTSDSGLGAMPST
ncbi:MAG: hypothetical protein IPF59_09460 [Ignavibacteria bacterium]|nr:hypothetical protein [Ignavibacteria bacterium]